MAGRFEQLVVRSRFIGLPIALSHAQLAGSLDGARRDPFDRMLIAQARIEDAIVVTADPVFRAYGVTMLWDA